MLFKVYHIGKDTVSIHSTTGDINCDHLAKLVDVDFLHYEVTITPFVFSILWGNVPILGQYSAPFLEYHCDNCQMMIIFIILSTLINLL